MAVELVVGQSHRRLIRFYEITFKSEDSILDIVKELDKLPTNAKVDEVIPIGSDSAGLHKITFRCDDEIE